MPVLELNHIRKRFGDLEVLQDISLSVAKGEVSGHHRPERQRQIHAAALRHAARSASTPARSALTDTTPRAR